METPKTRQRFFMAKELRLSISLIVIGSLFTGILFAYTTKLIGEKGEHGIFSFIAVFLGYVAIVVLFALFFTHRFLGPFERLKMEIRLILAGNYHRRLHVRHSDDFYIKSFIGEVNKILDAFEENCFDKDKFRKNLDSELLTLLSLIEKEDGGKEKLREAALAFREKVDSLIKSNKK